MKPQKVFGIFACAFFVACFNAIFRAFSVFGFFVLAVSIIVRFIQIWHLIEEKKLCMR